jgi:hypothetical protein
MILRNGRCRPVMRPVPRDVLQHGVGRDIAISRLLVEKTRDQFGEPSGVAGRSFRAFWAGS